MEKQPLVTVLMPVYNAEEFVDTAIESILSQTFSDFEFIIINDGSTDRSREKILLFRDERIKYYENDANLKLAETLNRGFALSAGKYIVRMDADDISFPERIEKQFAFMESHPDVGICGTAMQQFGFSTGNYFYETDDTIIRFKFLHECHLLHPSAIIRTKILREHDLKMTVIHGGDYEFFLKIAGYSRMANLKEVLIRYRQLENSMSKANSGPTYDNTNALKLGLFRKLYQSFDTEDVVLFKKLADQDYDHLINHIDRVESIVKKMIPGNLKNKVYPEELFTAYVAEMWFAFLNHKPVSISKIRRALFSDINGYRNKNFMYSAKLLVKSLFNL